MDERAAAMNGELLRESPGDTMLHMLYGPLVQAQLESLFALWKDADPDIPILKEAKAEYAKLQ